MHQFSKMLQFINEDMHAIIVYMILKLLLVMKLKMICFTVIYFMMCFCKKHYQIEHFNMHFT